VSARKRYSAHSPSRPAMVLVIAGLLLLVGPQLAGAKEYLWSPSINSSARFDPINSQVLPIRYPVLGDTRPWGTTYTGGPTNTGADDFCAARTYQNSQCKSGTGHAGNDIMPITGSPLGQHPIIAAYGGTVLQKACYSGTGNRVVIQGFDGRWYHYYHMNSFGFINVGQVVNAGHLIGFMGATSGLSGSSCTNPNGLGQHLHFQIHQGTNSTGCCAIDPYYSLRESFAWLGRASDGFGLDASFQTAWNTAAAPYGTVLDRMYYVGWPSVTTSGNANTQSVTSSFGTAGLRQFLVNGFTWYSGDFRSGVIVKANSSPAYVVPRELYTVYQNHNLWSGFLGFPTGHYGALRQNFQGGCIALGGSGWQAASYGVHPCN
jgi:murein DD-endopeptidase MepM/ murein hydrolase activator NlpD